MIGARLPEEVTHVLRVPSVERHPGVREPLDPPEEVVEAHRRAHPRIGLLDVPGVDLRAEVFGHARGFPGGQGRSTRNHVDHGREDVGDACGNACPEYQRGEDELCRGERREEGRGGTHRGKLTDVAGADGDKLRRAADMKWVSPRAQTTPVTLEAAAPFGEMCVSSDGTAAAVWNEEDAVTIVTKGGNLRLEPTARVVGWLDGVCL